MKLQSRAFLGLVLICVWAQALLAHEPTVYSATVKQRAEAQYEVQMASAISRVDGTGVLLRLPVDCNRNVEGRFSCADSLVGRSLGVESASAKPGDAVMLHFNATEGSGWSALLRLDAGDWLVPGSRSFNQVFSDYFTVGLQHLFSGAIHVLLIVGLVLLYRASQRSAIALAAFAISQSVVVMITAFMPLAFSWSGLDLVLAFGMLLIARDVVLPGRQNILREQPALVGVVLGTLHGLALSGVMLAVGLPVSYAAVGVVAFAVSLILGQAALALLVMACIMFANHALSSRKHDDLLSDPRSLRLGAAIVGMPAAYLMIRQLHPLL